MTPLILTADDVPNVADMGGKGAALARLAPSHGAMIPPWFVLSPRAFALGLADDQRRAFESRDVDPAALAATVERAVPSADVRDAIAAALCALPGAGPLAVRSSAVDEDGAGQSFAGQLESFLFVPDDQVADRVAGVWRSGFSERVFAYRREHGLSPLPAAPAVIVQRMVDADVSGVAFGADPVTGSRSVAVVSAVFGLGTALVGGEGDADVFRVDRAGRVIDQRVARKSTRHVADAAAPQGVRTEPSPDAEADRATLSPDELRRVVNLVRSVGERCGRPQDVEWAMRGGELFLLQARPITAMAALADPDGARAVWDNANIAESYNGVTTPLTFSFARRAYGGAYREFCKLMKVPRSVVADHDAMFDQMLGLIRGRIYYNLLNWYRLLAMLPGYSVNGKFMEQMMGVREGLPQEIAAGVAQRTWSRRQADRLRLAWSAAGLAWNHLVLPRKIRAFYARLDEALAPPDPPLAEQRLDQLAAEFRTLESRLLSRWDAPLINDFLAMIFFGALGKASAQWCDGGGTLHNDLLSDEGGIVSTEPARRINAMAAALASHVDPSLADALCDGDARAAERRLPELPDLDRQYRDYLEKFGDRCLEELKLESATLTDDPTPLLRTIGQAARRRGRDGPAPAPFRPRPDAERRARRAMAGRPARRIVFDWLLRHARRRVKDRENLRFERTRLFGRVRRLVVQIGRRLVAEGLLDDERDVFHLTIDELLGFVEGTSVDVDLRGIARRRSQAFAEYRAGPAPADRFETRGAVHLGNAFAPAARVTAEDQVGMADGTLRGVGCCPGIVRGPVRVIRDPRGAHLRHGEILVAERTDPGWIMLFPAAAGVLVERGSLLSHSAIVAREMGIPAIVSIPNLMRTLEDGLVVEMNGATGVIQVIDSDRADGSASS